MKRSLGFLFAAIAMGVAAAVLAVLAPTLPARAVSLSDKTALQAAMQQHVDRQTVDGAYLYFDTNSARVRALHPVTAHPMIMQMGDHFVLCFDFLDDTGKQVQVDYYMARKGRSFVVFHSAFGKRDKLMALVRAGKVKPAE